MTKRDFIREILKAVWWIFAAYGCVGMGAGILLGIFQPLMDVNTYLTLAFIYLAAAGVTIFYGLHRIVTVSKDYIEDKQVPF
jgi:flagellar biosynthesis protein FliQ